MTQLNFTAVLMLPLVTSIVSMSRSDSAAMRHSNHLFYEEKVDISTFTGKWAKEENLEAEHAPSSLSTIEIRPGRYGKRLEIIGKEGDSSLFGSRSIRHITDKDIDAEGFLVTQTSSKKRELQEECRIIFLKEENKLIIFNWICGNKNNFTATYKKDAAMSVKIDF